MIYIITGTPGAKKTAYCVAYLDKIETENKINLVKNIGIYQHNLALLEKNNLQSDLTYYVREVGTGEQLRQQIEILDDDYFHFIVQEFEDLRPDFYFARTSQFNEIIERINDRQGELGFKYFLPVRTIYTNINACKIDYVRALLSDWRKCPDGSIVVIDEIQLVKPFDDDRSRGNPMIEELSTHRHRGFDFYLITQQPLKLHTTIRGLVHLHWHATTPFGWYTKIYQYGQFEQQPNAVRVRLGAEKSFKFKPPDRIFKLYKSTTINTAEKRLPWFYIIGIGGLVLFGLLIAIYSFGKLFLKKDEVKNTKLPVAASAPATIVSAKSLLAPASASASSAVPTKVASVPATAQIDYQSLRQQQTEFNYQQKLRSKPVNVISFGNTCTAYNMDGLPLDLSFKECQKYAMGKNSTIKKMQSQIQTQQVTTSVSAPVS